MKNYFTLALTLILTLALMAGCRRSEPKDTTAATGTTTAPATTVPATQNTTLPSTETTRPSVTEGTGNSGSSDASDGLLDGAMDDAIDDRFGGPNYRTRGINSIRPSGRVSSVSSLA